MTLKRRRNGNKITLVLTECPACGKSFSHKAGHERAMHFVNDHGPADFGLSPMWD